MPRAKKGPRLWLKPAQYDRTTGRLRKRAIWFIKNGIRRVSTGCGAEDRDGAEQALAEYLVTKHEPNRGHQQPAHKIPIADVIAVYLEERAPDQANPEKARGRAKPLLEFWGDKMMSDINGRACREYVTWRTAQPWKSSKPHVTGNRPRMITVAGARRELEDLRAAVAYHRKEGYCREVIEVTLPRKSPPKDVWLRRDEAARLIWTCWRMREEQTIHRGARKGEKILTSKRPARHLARFAIVALYTGTRASAVCGACFEPTEGHGWIDLESGLFFRQARGRHETNKRQPPIRLPDRLFAHIRRWKRLNPDLKFVVEFNGKPIRQVNKGFATAVGKAGLNPKVTPHACRHTCATWLMQRGANRWDAAAFLGMTEAMLDKVYGHWHPDYQAAHFVPPPFNAIFNTPYHPRRYNVRLVQKASQQANGEAEDLSAAGEA